MKDRLARLFPTLATWPAEKWMIAPLVVLLFFALIIGIAGTDGFPVI